MSEIFLETNNSKRIMERARRVAKSGFNLVITGTAGSGKSAIAEELAREFKNSNYSVVDMMAGNSKDNRTNFYLRMLLKELDPDLRVPGAMELKFKEIRKIFLSSFAHRKKIVLIVDEAQNLNLSTIRGLKNIREQSRIVSDGKVHYMLSIIFFCKNYRNFLDNFVSKDPGDRFLIEEMGTLEDTEVLDIAKSIFGLKFENNAAKRDFVEAVEGYPSAIEKIYFFLETSPNFDGIVTTKSLVSARLLQAKSTLRQAGMNETDFVEYLRKEKQMNVSANEVKKAFSGKETKNSETILEAMKDFSKTIGI
jgi:Fe-S cluster assembly ATPase SufC